MRGPTVCAVAVLAALASGSRTPAQVASLANLERVSVDSAGGQSNADSNDAALSADGRWVAFSSTADNLVPGDQNGLSDIFLHDRRSGTTTRVSLSTAGAEARVECVNPGVSGDGRLVVFQSDSDTLVEGDTNGFADVFVRDTRLGTTTRVSVGAQGQQAQLPCVEPAISDDGRCVAFQSYSTNLGAGSTIGIQDVFVRDLALGTTSCVSLGLHGQPANHSSWEAGFSADGRLVVFYSQASNLVANDHNGAHDVFVFDRATGLTDLVSVSSSGAQGDGPSLSARLSSDGRWVAFTSYAKDLVPFDDNTDSDVFVHDRLTGTTELASQNSLGRIGNEESSFPGISGDGRFVVFQSMANNLSAEPDLNTTRDIFLRDRRLGTTARLSVGLASVEGQAVSQDPVIAAGALVVAFDSRSDNFVSLDSNDSSDVFVRDDE